jgi:hypothetical protein
LTAWRRAAATPVAAAVMTWSVSASTAAGTLGSGDDNRFSTSEFVGIVFALKEILEVGLSGVCFGFGSVVIIEAERTQERSAGVRQNVTC